MVRALVYDTVLFTLSIISSVRVNPLHLYDASLGL